MGRIAYANEEGELARKPFLTKIMEWRIDLRHPVIDSDYLCTGCASCSNACPQDAIIICEDPRQRYGLTAYIESTKCIECGKCAAVCPVINKHSEQSHNETCPECFVVSASDKVLRESSSGGVFTLLAEEIIGDSGYVAGATYKEDFSVCHKLINNIDDLDSLRRSKYMQSVTDGIFREIKEILPEKKVLFVGTPCQVAGLKAFLSECGGVEKNLFTVDLYCTQAPPPFLFRKYLKETFQGEKVTRYDFRVKDRGWRADSAKVRFADGREKLLDSNNDPYQRMYHNRLAMREVCEKCQFADFPRQGDLSIADFWWIEESYPEYNNLLGTSAVLVNNEHGRELFERAMEKAAVCVKVSLEAMKKNRPVEMEAHNARNRFYDLVDRKSFGEAADLALNRKYDIVLWGNWSERNYGSELTYFALYRLLRSMEYEVLLAERPRSAVWGPNDRPVLFRENPYPDYDMFIADTKTDMYELNDRADIFMVGSDQIWHHDLYDCFGKVCYLDFISPRHRKIAYAASFGRVYWDGTPSEAAEVSALLDDFEAVSVREASGVSLCSQLFGRKAEAVLDPVLLCGRDVYEKLIDQELKKEEFRSAHIAVYVLDITDEKEALIRKAEEKLSLPSYIITDAFLEEKADAWNRKIEKDATEEEWIANFITSEYIITDSFHGMCLAILFQKPFIAIANESRGSNRFLELLQIFGLKDQVLTEECDLEKADELFEKKIDFEEVGRILEEEKKRSFAWLESALNDIHEGSGDPTYIALRDEMIDQIRHFSKHAHRQQELNEWFRERLDGRDEIDQWQSEILDYHDKIEKWHTERLDNTEKIHQWHTERLDYEEKIQQWHTDQLKDIQERLAHMEEAMTRLARLPGIGRILSGPEQERTGLKKQNQQERYSSERKGKKNNGE